MVKSAPMRDHSIIIKPRRRSSGGLVALLLLFLIICLLLIGFGVFFPARLALVQERTLGLLHGGIVERTERTYVDACVQVQGADGPQAVTRTVRTIAFGDGTSLAVIFSSAPTPTNTQCSG